MATQIRASLQAMATTVVRSLLNVTTSGSAVIAKIIAGTGISLSSTGADAGTGDVTIALDGTGITVLGSSAGGSAINDSTLTPQQLGATITITANTIQQGDSLVMHILARESVAPTVSSVTITMTCKVDGTIFSNTSLTGAPTDTLLRVYGSGVGFYAVNPSGNNITIYGAATSGTNLPLAFPASLLASATTALPLAFSQVGLLTIDMTVTHTFSFFVTFSATHGLQVTPEMVRVARFR